MKLERNFSDVINLQYTFTATKIYLTFIFILISNLVYVFVSDCAICITLLKVTGTVNKSCN